MEIYVVKPGDTLTRISAAFGIPLWLLKEINGLEEDSLVPGQALLILYPAAVHVVQPGDTLYRIARDYGVTVADLYRNNPGLMGDSSLMPGMRLAIAYVEEGVAPIYVSGYTYPSVDESIFRQVLPYLTAMDLFSYGFSPAGALLPPAGEELVVEATKQGVDPYLVLAPLDERGNFNSDLISQVFSDEAKRSRLLGELVAEAEAQGFQGVSLDLEYVPKDLAETYAEFSQELGDMLRSRGLSLRIALAPKTSPTQKGILYEGHDYRALGEAADSVLLMTYEWGYTYGPPLAVAPLNEVRKVVEYAITEIPPQKILLGIPNYGYDWTLPFEKGRPADSISNPEAVELARRYGATILYDETAQSPHFSYYTPEGVEHVVWFEDIRSIAAKLSLRDEYDLLGVGYWTIMRPFVPNWMLLTTGYAITKGPTS